MYSLQLAVCVLQLFSMVVADPSILKNLAGITNKANLNACQDQDTEEKVILIRDLEAVNKIIRGAECGKLKKNEDNDYENSPEFGYYKLYPSPKSWTEARIACIKDKARLATFSTERERTLLLKILEQKHNDLSFLDTLAWIGVYKDKETWTPVCGETGEYYWKEDEISQLKAGNNCVGLYHYPNDTMSSFNCADKYAYICQQTVT